MRGAFDFNVFYSPELSIPHAFSMHEFRDARNALDAKSTRSYYYPLWWRWENCPWSSYNSCSTRIWQRVRPFRRFEGMQTDPPFFVMALRWTFSICLYSFFYQLAESSFSNDRINHQTICFQTSFVVVIWRASAFFYTNKFFDSDNKQMNSHLVKRDWW